jgi:hypothetical protein
MIKLVTTVCIDAPVPIVWERLAALEDIAVWSEAVLSARIAGPIARGVGAERVCALAGNLTIHERWVEWNEGSSYRYVGTGLPMIARASNRWSLHPEGSRQTLLRSEAEIELKRGVLGRMLEPIIGVGMRRLGPNALAGFKYLVEHGRPYEGRQADLAPVPAGC